MESDQPERKRRPKDTNLGDFIMKEPSQCDHLTVMLTEDKSHMLTHMYIHTLPNSFSDSHTEKISNNQGL